DADDGQASAPARRAQPVQPGLGGVPGRAHGERWVHGAVQFVGSPGDVGAARGVEERAATRRAVRRALRRRGDVVPPRVATGSGAAVEGSPAAAEVTKAARLANPLTSARR